MARVIRVCAVQMWDENSHQSIPSSSVDSRLRGMKFVEEAGKQGVDLVVLPECWTDPRPVSSDTGNWCERMESLPGPTSEMLSELARRYHMYVIGWVGETGGENGPYNTSYLLDRDGNIVGHYRKVHTTAPIGETAGNEWTIFETDFGRLGIMICLDNYFPETSRILTLRGAELLVHALTGDQRGSETAVILQRARSIDCCVPLVGACLEERSVIVSNQGEILADSKGHAGVIIASLDLDHEALMPTGGGRFIRLAEHTRALRRPEIYGDIVAPNPRPRCRHGESPEEYEHRVALNM